MAQLFTKTLRKLNPDDNNDQALITGVLDAMDEFLHRETQVKMIWLAIFTSENTTLPMLSNSSQRLQKQLKSQQTLEKKSSVKTCSNGGGWNAPTTCILFCANRIRAHRPTSNVLAHRFAMYSARAAPCGAKRRTSADIRTTSTMYAVIFMLQYAVIGHKTSSNKNNKSNNINTVCFLLNQGIPFAPNNNQALPD